MVIHKKSNFSNKADKSPIIKLVSSIQFKKLESNDKPIINDLLSNAVNPAGLQFDIVRKSSMSRNKSVYQLPVE